MLREEREKAGMSTIELAKKSGVSRDVIHRIELRNYQKAKPITISKLANALGIDREKILN